MSLPSEHRRRQAREWRANHLARQRLNSLEWYRRNKKRAAQNLKAWKAKNKDRIKAYYKNRMMTVPQFRIRKQMSIAVHTILKRSLGRKLSVKTMQLVGCTSTELKKWLESKFKDGMTWENYGKRGWHVDHIIPACQFNLINQNEREVCFHYTNLQPLWWWENISKGGHIRGPFLPAKP